MGKEDYFSFIEGELSSQDVITCRNEPVTSHLGDSRLMRKDVKTLTVLSTTITILSSVVLSLREYEL